MKKAIFIPLIFFFPNLLAQLDPQVEVLFGLTYGKANAEISGVADLPLKAGTKTGMRLNFAISDAFQFEIGYEYVFKTIGFHFSNTDNGMGTRKISLALDDFEIPILLVQSVHINSSWIIKPIIGISYCIFHDYGSNRMGTINPTTSYFERIEYNTISRNYASARLSGQILKTLSNGNNLGFNLDFNFHNNPLIEGIITKRDQSGLYSTEFEYSGTYFSISIIYLFKLNKKAGPSLSTEHTS